MEKFKLVKYKKNAVVVQDNTLIEAPRNLGKQEQKMFLFLIANLNSRDSIEEQKQYYLGVNVKDFAKTIGLNNLQDAYRDVRSCIKQLQEKVLTIKMKDSKEVMYISILSYASFLTDKGYAYLKFNPDVLPFLMELKSKFTKYKLENITHLSSIYAIRLYELLKQMEVVGQCKFELNDLRHKLNISDGKLTAFQDFKKRVLLIAKREINTKTDLTIDFLYIKTGKKITHILCYIENKENYDKNSNMTCISNDNSSLLLQIKNLGIRDFVACDIINKYSFGTINNAMKIVEEQLRKGNVRNPAALFQAALKFC